jgi:hypothetical protein
MERNPEWLDAAQTKAMFESGHLVLLGHAVKIVLNTKVPLALAL